MLTIRKSLLDTLEPNTKEFDGAQDHNLTLRPWKRLETSTMLQKFYITGA